MVNLLVEAAMGKLRQVADPMRLHHLGYGHACVPEGLNDLVTRSRGTPPAQVFVDLVVASPSSGDARQLDVRRPCGMAEAGDQVRPLLVGRYRDRHPIVGTSELVEFAGAVKVLRCRGRAAVPLALQQVAVRRVLDDLLGGDVERGVDHRGLDPDAIARAPPMRQGQHQRVEAVHTGVRVADRIRFHRILVGMAGQPGDAGGVLDHVRERRFVPPRAVEPEAGHAHHDRVGTQLVHRVEVEPDLVEHSRCVVLDDDVTRLHEAAQ